VSSVYAFVVLRERNQKKIAATGRERPKDVV
jgi:hypothetical protein